MVVSYLIGHRVGKPFLYRYGKWFKLTPNRIERAEGWFKKYGLWTVFFGYFVPGVRHFTCYLSGVSGVKFYKYMFYAGTGALLWCTTFLTLGHFIGSNLEGLFHLIHTYMGISLLIISGSSRYWNVPFTSDSGSMRVSDAQTHENKTMNVILLEENSWSYFCS